VLKFVKAMCGSQFAAEMAPLELNGAKPKVEFTPIDWAPAVTL
jgi:hypothetical protein